MRTILFSFGLLVLGCGEMPDPPPAKVGATEAPAKDPVFVQENRSVAQREELDIASWAERHRLNMVRTGTGVRVHLLRDEPGRNAGPGDDVLVDFKVTLIDGRECYKSAPGQPEAFKVEEDHVESGLHEAIQYMSRGDSAVVVIPSHRAHGLIGDQQRIPPRSTVIYHIALVDLRPKAVQ